MDKCVVLEMENSLDFAARLEVYLRQGYKVHSSSCNSRYFKAILLLEVEEE